MAETAQRIGHTFVPRLGKVSGGAGNPSLYRIEAEPLDEKKPTAMPVSAPAGDIYYTPESVSAPGAIFGQAFRRGIIPWTAMMRWLLFAAMLGLWLGTSLWYWLLVAGGLSITRPISMGDVLGASLWLLILVGIASVFRFLNRLFTLRIMIAPDLLTPLAKENVTLEMRLSTSDERPGELMFARYSSTCAVCGGEIMLFDGGREFSGRIVGRCRRSAREHVYSFDPARSIGYPLRSHMV